MKLILIIAIGLLLFLSGCTQPTATDDTTTDNNAIGDQGFGSFSKKSSCTGDENCLFAINAYPLAECISSNCPLPSEPQPTLFDPEYDWEEGFESACVNPFETENLNVLGEELLLDIRSVECVCKESYCEQKESNENEEDDLR